MTNGGHHPETDKSDTKTDRPKANVKAESDAAKKQSTRPLNHKQSR
jgi:hypothetical protein